MTERRWDILGLGCVAMDDLLSVDAFPDADQKTRVTQSERQCGGLTGTALVAASRLGAKCAYAGLLGSDELSQYVEANFNREGVDTTHVARQAEARPIHSTIIVAGKEHTRNIFFDVTGRTGAAENLPEADVIAASRVLFIDSYNLTGNLRAAKIARENGVAVVADLELDEEAGFGELLNTIDHLVLSEQFALKITGTSDADKAAAKLLTPARAAVVVTCGDRGCWSITPEAHRPLHHPPFRVDVVDTTGCGDVFHGAYAAALARGEGLAQRIEFAASAAAAMKAMHAGGQKGIPQLADVRAFLSK